MGFLDDATAQALRWPLTDPMAKLLVSRRGVLQIGLSLGALPACKQQQAFTCTDVSDLSVRDLQTREKLAYRDRTAKPELACDLCTQYVPPSGSGCGTCRVVPGPTHPKGSCKVFAKKG